MIIYRTAATGRVLGSIALVAGLTLSSATCSRTPDVSEPRSAETAASPTPDGTEPLPPPKVELDLPDDVRGLIDEPFTGDLDEMIARRLIRAGVTFNRTHYFVDAGVQRGIAYEYIKLFEDELNKKLKTGNLKVHVVFVPLPRDLLLPALTEGKVDLVAAQLTITPEREAVVDFTIPTRRDVSEVVVTGPGAPTIATVDDLSGQDVVVRRTSSYHQSLVALNERLVGQGRSPVTIVPAPEELEDDDLLEMTNAGLIPITVVDDYVATFWAKILSGLTIHDTVAVRTGGRLAVAIRKHSPKLAAEADAFIQQFGLGRVFGNILEKRYLQSTKYVRNATSEAERRRLETLVSLFRKYGDQYGLDYLLVAAQGYQESGLDQTVKSRVGAIGVMQVMPETGRELDVGDITQLEPNIHAGTKYIRFMIDQYFKDEPMDDLNRGLFAFASYNAGPGRIRQLRREAERRGLDPNVWFGNVERVASERIGRETVTYVSNIYKYYIAYRLLSQQAERKKAAKSAIGQGGGN